MRTAGAVLLISPPPLQRRPVMGGLSPHPWLSLLDATRASWPYDMFSLAWRAV